MSNSRTSREILTQIRGSSRAEAEEELLRRLVELNAQRAALARQSLPPEAIAGQFKRSPKAAVLAVLEALEELGMVQREGEAYRLQG